MKIKVILRENIFEQHFYGENETCSKLINSIEKFYKNYSYPLFAKIKKIIKNKNFYKIDYEFNNLQPILDFIQENPAEIEKIWEKLINLVRYLKYNNIALSDLKPENIYINKESQKLQVFGIIPEKNIINLRWSAPEQYRGNLSWKSNLYTFAMIICFPFIKPEEIKKEDNVFIKNRLKKMNSAFLKTLLPKILNEYPSFRPEGIKELLPDKIEPQKPQQISEQKYENYLEFHKLLCDNFLTYNISYQTSFYLFRKYCFAKSTSFKNFDYIQKVNYIPISEIIKSERIRWIPDSICFNLKEKAEEFDVNSSLRAFKQAYQNWDFTKYQLSFTWIKQNLKLFMDLPIKRIQLILLNLWREAEREKVINFLKEYFDVHYSDNQPTEDFLFLWKFLTFSSFNDDFIKYEKYEKESFQQIKVLRRLKALLNKRDILKITKLLSDKICSSTKSLILSIICQNSNKFLQSYFDQLIATAKKQNNFYQIANLLSFEALYNEEKSKEKMEYSLMLAIMTKSSILFYMVLFRIMSLAVKNNDFNLQEQIVKIFEKEVTSRNLNPKELNSIHRQLVNFYYRNEQFEKCSAFIENNIEFNSEATIPLFLIRYLQIKVRNRVFAINRKFSKMIKDNRKAIKRDFKNELKEISLYLKFFAKKNEIDRWERMLAWKLSPLKKHFLLNLESDLKSSKIVCEKFEKDNSLYKRAERTFYQGLYFWNSSKRKNSLSFFNLSQQLFNKIGLFARAQQIEKYFNEFPINSELSNELNWEDCFADFKEVKTKDEFSHLLEGILFTWLGFNIVKVFSYQENLDSFTPLKTEEKNITSSLEVINFSRNFIKHYQEDNNFLKNLTNFEVRKSNSINLSEIDNSFCVPIEFLDQIIGVVYLKSHLNEIILTKEKFRTLILFLAAISPFLKNLLEKDKISEITSDDFYGIVGKSQIMEDLKKKIKVLSKLNYSVLITGESGVGKELVAQALFKDSVQKGEFVSINCPNFSKELFESELFGHKKGSFSSAIENKVGKIELAENGTILFDEIGDMPLAVQAKMLRVIENREFCSVGCNKLKKTNARFIFATNKNLEQLVVEGKFREDLLARINQFAIEIPSLRERPEDINDLVIHFTKIFKKENPQMKIKEISTQKIDEWKKAEWPYNIRQIKYEIYRELMQIDIEQNKQSDMAYIFKVDFKNKFDKKQIVKKYAEWLLETTGSKEKVMEILKVSVATYYRLIK